MTMNLTSEAWWNAAIGRSIRTFWHWVGFYFAAENVVDTLTMVLVIGEPPTIFSISMALVVKVVGTLGVAIGFSALRPRVSAARTLAFGSVAWILFILLLIAFVGTEHPLSGNPLLSLDVGLAALGALSLAAAVGFGFDPTDLQ